MYVCIYIYIYYTYGAPPRYPNLMSLGDAVSHFSQTTAVVRDMGNLVFAGLAIS